jgi:hypothetical protein
MSAVQPLHEFAAHGFSRAIQTVERVAPRLGTALNIPARRRRRLLLQHHVGWRRPVRSSQFVPTRHPDAGDIAIAERLNRAYRAAEASGPVIPGQRHPDQWTLVYRQQNRFVSLLGRDDAPALAAYLCNAARHDASNGILQGDYEYRLLSSDTAYREWADLLIRDKLVSLAEAVGAAPAENPEATFATGSLRRTAPGPLVHGISARLGIDIAPPDVDGDLFKLDTGRGQFGVRDLLSIYTAHLVRGALRGVQEGNGRGAPQVCEIGAGSGRVAYWCRKLGLSGYTIVDLPHVNVVQGYYLLKALPQDRIVLYGEPGWEEAVNCVRILPAHAATGPDGHAYDLVLNQDSFPEMSLQTVLDYVAWIKQVGAGGLLMSINHESKAKYGRGASQGTHVCVPEAVEQLGGLERIDRNPFWLRRGYVTELYRVAD